MLKFCLYFTLLEYFSRKCRFQTLAEAAFMLYQTGYIQYLVAKDPKTHTKQDASCKVAKHMHSRDPRSAHPREQSCSSDLPQTCHESFWIDL